MAGLIQVNGFYWPEEDKDCRSIVFHSVSELDLALKYVSGRTLAVQAGGNCGVWPAHLAKVFERVITFEPDETNYSCLVRNVPANVDAVRAALGDVREAVGLHTEARNIGAHYVDGSGTIQQIVLDDLELKACDFLCLDIEGMEPLAIKGAQKTIDRFRPVILVEDKGLSERYGVPRDWSSSLDGYSVAARIARDVLLVPN